jgi:hypothetical protein
VLLIMQQMIPWFDPKSAASSTSDSHFDGFLWWL